MSNTGQVIAATLSLIFGLAIVAVLVSKNSATPGLISDIGTGFSGMISNVLGDSTSTATATSSNVSLPTLSPALAGAGTVGSGIANSDVNNTFGGTVPFGGDTLGSILGDQ
jgi:hypothetical protein